MGMRLTPLLVLLIWAFPSSLSGAPPSSSLPQTLDHLWSDLAGPDAGKAYQAIWVLSKTPPATTAFISAHLQPVLAPDPKAVQRLIEDLNSGRFSVRDKATAELTRLGGLVEPALRQALKADVSLETRQRIEKLLHSLLAPLTIPDHLRAVRAVENLEYIATADARKLLARYAAGAPGARLTQDAREALERLARMTLVPLSPSRADLLGDPLPAGAVGRLGTIRFRRTNSYQLMGFELLTDGKSLVTASGNVIQVWEIPGGRLRQALNLGPVTIGGFAMAADGKTIAVAVYQSRGPGPREDEIRVLAFPSGDVLRTFPRNQQYRWELAISPDSKLLFSRGEREAIVRVEDIASGKQLLQRKLAGNGYSTGLALSPDGRYLTLASQSKVFLWKWQGGEPEPLPGIEGSMRWMAFSPDGRLLAGVEDYDKLCVWDVPSGRIRYQQVSADGTSTYFGNPVFAPDGKTMALPLRSRNATRRGRTELLDPATGRSLAILEGGGGSIAVSADSQLLAVATGTGARFWDLRTRKELWPKDDAHEEAPSRMVVSQDLVVTASDDNTVRIWDAAMMKQRRKFSIPSWVRGVAVSPDGTRLAASGLDDAVHLWDMRTGAEIYRLAGHGRLGGRRLLAFQGDGKGLFSWGDDYYLRLWDMKTGKARLEHAIRPSGIDFPNEDEDDDGGRGVALKRDRLMLGGGGVLAPDGKTFVLGMGTNLHLFDTATGKETRILPSEGGPMRAMAVSPDSKKLLVESYRAGERSISLVDLTSGKTLQRFPLEGSIMEALVYSTDGRMFATAGNRDPGEILIFETASGKARATIRGYASQVRSLVFFPDGRHLASGLSDSTALIWDLTSPAHLPKGP